MEISFPTTPQAGDYGLVPGSGLAMRVIRWGTRSKYGHAFVCTAVRGDRIEIVEAQPGGARVSHADHYPAVLWMRVEGATKAQRATIVRFAYAYVGTPYGWLDIAALVLRWAGFQDKSIWRRLEDDKTVICSQLVTRCYTEAGIALRPEKWACEVTPGMLEHATPALVT